jgi:hypothetical protein
MYHYPPAATTLSGFQRIRILACPIPTPPTRMIMNTFSIVRIAGALICSTIALPAQTLTVTLNTVSPFEQLSGSFNGGTSFDLKTAGVLDFDYTDAFCVEPLQPVSGTVVYDLPPNSSLTDSASIAKVVGAYLASSRSSREAAGAQWAIWEIASDGISSPSFRNGSVQIFFDRRGGSVQALGTEAKALEYLSLSQLPSTPSASFLYATHPTSQNVVFMIPEPSSALLGALSITALLVRRRR